MLAPSHGRGGPPALAPPAALRAISGRGQRLDASSRAALEPRLGRDLGNIRVHTSAEAGQAARELNALAYTIGQDIAFAPDQYRPETPEGRQLLAHEVTHTIQQRGTVRPASDARIPVDAADSPAEREARLLSGRIGAGGHGRAGLTAEARLCRADPDAVSRVAALGRSQGTGLQFIPADITDTVVGPPPSGGGLIGDRQERLNVVIGEQLTPRLLARALLPLYITATPFQLDPTTPPVPLQIIDEETLARGLLMYNQSYLPLPAMTNWRAGLRFPLPIGIDPATGVATLHPTVIANLAASFDAAHAPALDQRAGGIGPPNPAQLVADTRQFLADNPTAAERGSALAARSLTNAPAERPFVVEVFRQLGADTFGVALEFMNAVVNRQVSILAAQNEGALILAVIAFELGSPPPNISAERQRDLDRANHMLGLIAAAPSAAAPGGMRTRPERTVTIDMIRLDGSTHSMATALAVANAIYAQCNMRVVAGVSATATPAETVAWLGANRELRASGHCGAPWAEQRALYANARAIYNIARPLRAYFIRNTEGEATGGWSCSADRPGTHALQRGVMVIHNSGDTDTLAHELGHHLITRALSDRHQSPGSPMQGRPRQTLTFSQVECNQIYNNAGP